MNNHQKYQELLSEVAPGAAKATKATTDTIDDYSFYAQPKPCCKPNDSPCNICNTTMFT